MAFSSSYSDYIAKKISFQFVQRIKNDNTDTLTATLVRKANMWITICQYISGQSFVADASQIEIVGDMQHWVPCADGVLQTLYIYESTSGHVKEKKLFYTDVSSDHQNSTM